MNCQYRNSSSNIVLLWEEKLYNLKFYWIENKTIKETNKFQTTYENNWSHLQNKTSIKYRFILCEKICLQNSHIPYTLLTFRMLILDSQKVISD